MSLKDIHQGKRQAKRAKNVRCSVTKAYLLFKAVSEEDAADMLVLLEGPDSGPMVADSINDRFKELGIDFEVKGGPINNHRRNGCTCGAVDRATMAPQAAGVHA